MLTPCLVVKPLTTFAFLRCRIIESVNNTEQPRNGSNEEGNAQPGKNMIRNVLMTLKELRHGLCILKNLA